VDEKTIFAIGSVSKSFTAAALAVLIDEGKHQWDDPVSKYLPAFQLYDPYATRELTVRDLLCHRAGLERGDLLWYAGDIGRDDILRRVRHLKPSWSFRSRFGYQNIMFLAAGQIVPRVAGKSWDDFVAERFFKPLGMADTTTSTKALPAGGNVATPHEEVEEKVCPVTWRNIDNVGPAGSINSNVTDMAQWVRLQLGSESVAKSKILGKLALKEMHTPQTVVPLDGVREKMNPDTHFMTYGLGWFLQDYHGKKLVQHGGAIDGMTAQVALVPEEKLGLVVLTNKAGTMLPTAVMNRVLDAYLGAPPRDWSAEMLKVKEGIDKIEKDRKAKEEKDRAADSEPSLPLEKYAGNYKDDFYGTAKVTREGDKLVLRYGTMVCDLEHWSYDTFRAKPRERHQDPFFFTARVSRRGKVEEAKIENPAGTATFRYEEEAPPAVVLSEAELAKFAGVYSLAVPPLEITVELVAGKLKANVPGQPATTLVPVSPVRFKVEGAPAGTFVTFELADGQVKAVEVESGGAKLTFKPKK
jgi:CubicO group peptidase (beta-lactamase class C family)